jgi:hypothetical protein
MSKTYTVPHSCELGELSIVLLPQSQLKSYLPADEAPLEAKENLIYECLLNCVRDLQGNQVWTNKESLANEVPAKYVGELYLAVINKNQPDFSKKN